MGWQGVTTRLTPASKEEQRSQPVPGPRNGVHTEVTHGVSGVVVKRACVHGLGQRKLSAQLPVLGSVARRQARDGVDVGLSVRRLATALAFPQHGA